MNKVSSPFSLGTKLEVINAGEGALGCNGKIVEVINFNGKGHRNGMCDYDNGFFVKDLETNKVWKVCDPGDKGAMYDIISGSIYAVELL